MELVVADTSWGPLDVPYFVGMHPGQGLFLICILCLLAGYWYAHRRSWAERVGLKAWEVFLWGPETTLADATSAVVAAAGVATPMAAHHLGHPRARRVAGAAAALLPLFAALRAQ